MTCCYLRAEATGGYCTIGDRAVVADQAADPAAVDPEGLEVNQTADELSVLEPVDGRIHELNETAAVMFDSAPASVRSPDRATRSGAQRPAGAAHD